MRITLCERSAVTPELPVRIVAPGGRPLAAFVVDGEIFVTDDTCTHGDASLAEGFLDGFEIECPYHMGRFDVRTGAVTGAPCTRPLTTYQATVEDGAITIDYPLADC